jgi:hypothetical protein
MANLTNLVGLMNELLPGVTSLARSRAKFDELSKFCYIGEGPSDQAAVTHAIHLGLPAAATVSDRAAAITSTRVSDVLLKTATYTPFRTHAHLTDVELNKLVSKGELPDVLTDGLVKCWERVMAAVRTHIITADDTVTIPDLGGGTDYLAATHTLADDSEYSNLGTDALDTAALQAGVDAMVLEKDWSGTYTNAMPNVLVASSAQKIHAAINSAYGSSALDANIGAGMGGVVLPGLGNFWMLSAGPNRNGLRIDFRAKGGEWDHGGMPWIDDPFEADDGQILIPFGVDFVVYSPTYLGQWISNGTT